MQTTVDATARFSGIPDYTCIAIGLAAVILQALRILGSMPSPSFVRDRHFTWTVIWVCLLFKMTDGRLSQPFFYYGAVVGFAALLISSLTVRRPGVGVSAIIVAMTVVWLVITLSVFTVPTDSGRTQWLILTIVGIGLIVHAQTTDSIARYWSEVFGGLSYALFACVFGIATFALLWPELSFQFSHRLVGPFGVATSLGISLLSLLIAYVLRCEILHANGYPAAMPKLPLILSILAFMIMTLTRSSALVAATFFVPYFALRSNAKSRLLVLVVGLSMLALVTYLTIPRTALERRLSLNSNGRASLFRVQLHEALERPVWGHGFGTSKHVDFDYRKYAEHASHNFYLSVFYEMGIPGVVVSALLLIAALTRLSHFSSHSKLPWLFWAFGCLLLLAMAENLLWYPYTVPEILMIVLMLSSDKRMDFTARLNSWSNAFAR